MVLRYYVRYYVHYVDEYETLEEAMRQAEADMNDCQGVTLWIVDTDGTEFDKDAVYKWNNAYNEAHKPPEPEPPEPEPPEPEPPEPVVPLLHYRKFKGVEWRVD